MIVYQIVFAANLSVSQSLKPVATTWIWDLSIMRQFYISLVYWSGKQISEALDQYEAVVFHCFEAFDSVKIATSAEQLLVLHLYGWIQSETVMKQLVRI